jgi:hypothetical protein
MNAATCCETLMQAGVATQLITSQPSFVVDASKLERIVQRKRLYEKDVDVALDQRLMKVIRNGQSFEATFNNTLTQAEETYVTDLLIVEAGTLPVEDLFDDLKPASVNAGVTNLDALVACASQNWSASQGKFELYRVGDAVTSRDIHTAIYDHRSRLHSTLGPCAVRKRRHGDQNARCTTEEQATTTAAGLIIGGKRPLTII